MGSLTFMILGFRRRPIIDRETIEWEFETFEWLLRNFGGHEEFQTTALVRPTDEDFPIEKGLAGHDLAEAVFSHVKRHAGMDDWPCTLMAQDTDPEPLVGLTELVQGIEPTPAGTFSVSLAGGAEVMITYNQSLLSDPISLVATLAHELSHFLMATAPALPPGDEELLEFATDLTAVFLGFGIFMANSHFRFEQFGDAFSHGWRTTRQGYMTERQLLFALAIFSTLQGIDAQSVATHLTPKLKRLYKRAAATVSSDTERLDVLRNTVGDRPAVG